ncbi:MAG: type II toxin-antitoxin system VapC family toxin [Chloroflexota bacterium]
MKYLLDTNICIALIRNKSTSLLQKLISQEAGEIGISSITLAELMHGVEKSQFPDQNRTAIQQFLLPLELVDFGERSAVQYGKIRSSLEKEGNLIGSMDMLIAAHALGMNAILVTNNTRDFKRIKGLVIEDWLHGAS